MNLKYVHNLNTGFTLIESLITLAFISVFVGFGLEQGTENYISTIGNTDKEMVLSALIHARSEAMNGTCFGTNCDSGAPHGVELLPSSATIFQGNTYADRFSPNDEQVALSEIQPAPTNNEVVFEALSGNVSSSTWLKWFETNNKSLEQTIEINSEGQLSVPSSNP